MRNRKAVGVIICFVIAFIILLTIRLVSSQNTVKSPKEGDVSCKVWLKMLCEQFGIENENQQMLKEDLDLEMEEPASGWFIAITSMRAIGEASLQIYLDTEQELKQVDYLNLALKLKLIKREQLRSGFTKKECEKVLEKLVELQYDELWKSDYAKIQYEDNVIKLEDAQILQKSQTEDSISVTKEVLEDISEGTVIIYAPDGSGYKIAKKVKEVLADGTLLLVDAELDEAISSAVVSEKKQVEFEDFLQYGGFTLDNTASTMSTVIVNKESLQVQKLSKSVSASVKSKGYTIGIEQESEPNNEGKYELKVLIQNNNTGISASKKLVSQDIGEFFTKSSVKITVGELEVASQLNYDRKGVAYSNLKLLGNSKLEVDATVGTNENKIPIKEDNTIPLVELPIPIADGIAVVDIKFCLVFTAEGSIKITAELPYNVGVTYNRGNLGNKLQGMNCTGKLTQNFSIQTTGQANSSIRAEGIVALLKKFNVADAELDTGVSIKAQHMARSDNFYCTDVSGYAPIMTLRANSDEEVDSILHKIKVTGVWELVNESNAPFHKTWHYEKYPDGTGAFVDNCTYNVYRENETTSNTSEQETEQVNAPEQSNSVERDNTSQNSDSANSVDEKQNQEISDNVADAESNVENIYHTFEEVIQESYEKSFNGIWYAKKKIMTQDGVQEALFIWPSFTFSLSASMTYVYIKSGNDVVLLNSIDGRVAAVSSDHNYIFTEGGTVFYSVYQYENGNYKEGERIVDDIYYEKLDAFKRKYKVNDELNYKSMVKDPSE